MVGLAVKESTYGTLSEYLYSRLVPCTSNWDDSNLLFWLNDISIAVTNSCGKSSESIQNASYRWIEEKWPIRFNWYFFNTEV
jgi:hypothetical protein